MIDPAVLDGPVGGAFLLAVLTTSLAGSVHCAGMCGPFVAVYAAGGSREAGRAAILRAHAAYHFGRAATYVSLGAIGGVAGAALDRAGTWAGIAHVAALVSGVLVIAWGLSVLVPVFRTKWSTAGLLGPALVKLGKKPRVFRASMLGIFTPLLPCGWLYAFVLTAAGTGSVLGGSAVMFAFWLGTVPALLGMGAILAHLGTRMRAKLPLVTGVALVALGLFAVTTRMAHVHPTSAKPEAASATMTPPARPSCH